MAKSLSEEKRREWQEKILQQKNSGQSVSRWCREHQVPYNGFVYWERRSKRRLTSPALLNRSAFKELSDSPQETGLTIEYQGVRIIVAKKFDSATLIRCIRAFGGLSC
jgi:hypothetical protein